MTDAATTEGKKRRNWNAIFFFKAVNQKIGSNQKMKKLLQFRHAIMNRSDRVATDL